MKTKITVTTKKLFEPVIIEKATKVYKVTIPVWVRDTARPVDGSSITDAQLAASGADMWLSITELRISNMKKVLPQIRHYDTIAAKGHNYEWLACGAIPKSRIIRVMPWDGTTLHKTQDVRIVRSIDSCDPWVIDWNTLMWRLDARLYRTACFLSTYGGNKRKVVDEDSVDELEGPLRKRRKTVEFTTSKVQNAKGTPKPKRTINPYDPDFTPDTSEQSGELAGCCSHCGQKKAPFHLDEEINGPLSYLDLAVPPASSSRR